MLFEYAIAPATLFEAAKKRQNYRSFMKEFQIGNPKVISEFPSFKQYKKLVKHQFPQCSNDNHESRLTELLMFIKSSLKVQRCAEYNGLQTWEDNAFDDHLRVPFDRLLSQAKIGTDQELRLEQFLEGVDEIDKAETNIVVERKAPQMAAAFSGILRLAERIILVDPYFRSKPRYWNTLSEFIRTSLDSRPGGPVAIEILYSDGSDQDKRYEAPDKPDVVMNAFQEKYPDLYERCDISFVSFNMPTGKPHNRYMLTNIGGVTSGAGFAEDFNQPNDDFSLLSKKSYEQRWDEYANGTGYHITYYASNKNS